MKSSNNQTITTGGRKPPTRRATRYGKLAPAWRWRTTAERLARMQAYCEAHGISHTEFLEQAADEKLAKE